MRSGGCDCRERCGRYRWREDWRPTREDGGGVTVDELPGGKGALVVAREVDVVTKVSQPDISRPNFLFAFSPDGG